MNSELSTPYSLHHEIRPEYLHVVINGEHISYEIARSYWDDVIKLQKETGSRRVFVQKEIPEVLPIADLFRLGSELAKHGLNRAKVALCDPHATIDTMVFSENVMVNRGLNGRAFTDCSAAKDWLLAN